MAILSLCSVIYFGFGYKWFLPKETSRNTNEKGEVTFTIPKKGRYAFPTIDSYIEKITQNGKELSITPYQSTVKKNQHEKDKIFYRDEPTPENPSFDTFQVEKGTIHVFTEIQTTIDGKIEPITLTLSKHVKEENYAWVIFVSIFMLGFCLFGIFKLNEAEENKK